MIRFEDKELENMVLAGESCIAVPFEIFIPSSGEPIITIYSFLKDVAEKFESRFADDLLSADALNWLDDQLSARVKDINYAHADDSSHHLLEYEADDCKICLDENVLGKVLLVTENDFPKGLDLSYFEDYNVEQSTSALFLEDDKVVCVATTNDTVFDDKSVEICVETLPGYEGRGFGTATVAVLCSFYNKDNVKVKYECAKSNIASVKVAEKCGFSLKGERYSYVCYAVEEE